MLTTLCILAAIATALTVIFCNVSEFTRGSSSRFSVWWSKVDLYAILGSYGLMIVSIISCLVVRIWSLI